MAEHDDSFWEWASGPFGSSPQAVTTVPSSQDPPVKPSHIAIRQLSTYGPSFGQDSPSLLPGPGGRPEPA